MLEKIYLKYKDKINYKSILERENELLYLGTPLEISVKNGNKNRFKFLNNNIEVELDSIFNKEIKEQLRDKFYKQQAPKVITPIVKYYEDIMKVRSSKLSYRKTKTQWGSCSYKNSISLNSYLVMLPKELIEYVVIHELSHIKHKNHSKEFWSLVECYCPEYKKSKAEIKKYGLFIP